MIKLLLHLCLRDLIFLMIVIILTRATNSAKVNDSKDTNHDLSVKNMIDLSEKISSKFKLSNKIKINLSRLFYVSLNLLEASVENRKKSCQG